MTNNLYSTASSTRPTSPKSLPERLKERLDALHPSRNAAGRSLVVVLTFAAFAVFALTSRSDGNEANSFRIENASRLAGQTAAANQLPSPTFEVASETGTAQSNSDPANSDGDGADDTLMPKNEKPTLAILASRLGRSTTTTAAPTTAAPTTAAPTTAAPTTAAPTTATPTTVPTTEALETTVSSDVAEVPEATVVVEVEEAGAETTVTTVEETTTTAAPTTAAPTTAANDGWVDTGNGVSVPAILLKIRFCESRDDYQAANRHSSARGAYQFLTGSWSAYGHAKRYGVNQAHLASPIQQDEAALITWRADGTRPWNASKHCWG